MSRQGPRLKRQPDFETTIPGDGPINRTPAQPRSLLVYHHDGADLVPLVNGVPVVLGRGASADLTFRGDRLSRRHAKFEAIDGHLQVLDLLSTNGTFVNGVRIEGSARLDVGDEVALGTVVATVTALAALDDVKAGLDNSDAFLSALQQDVVRARTFGRKTALLMVRDMDGQTGELHRWAGEVRRATREVDRVGLYQPGQVGVIFSEADRIAATAFAQELIAKVHQTGRRLAVGIAVYPECGRGVDELVAVVGAAVERANEDQRIVFGGRSTGRMVIPKTTEEAADDIVVRAPSMLALYRRVDQVALAPVPVLVLGETGTGKEVVARSIHERSKRAERPLLGINCGAIQRSLMEAELFGHTKGAFTGADRTRKGVFEVADGGTVFLDEVAELPPAAQAALLRVLDAGVIRRVGSTKEITVDVRVIAATNRNLEAMVEKGDFRLDLLHRINLITIQIPPLRERLSEILPLCNLFIRNANIRYERQVDGMLPEVLPLLLKYHWPGNVRELRNVMERAVLTALEGRIALEDLPAKLRRAAALEIPAPAVDLLNIAIRKLPEPSPEPHEASESKETPLPAVARRVHVPTLKEAVGAVESTRVYAALSDHEGNRAAAAKALGVPRRTLDHKIATRGYDKRPSVAQLGVMARFSHPDDESLSLKEQVERLERRLISRALEQTSSNLVDVARLLGIDRRTLQSRIQRYGL